MSTIGLFGFVDEKTTKLEISGSTTDLANGTEVNILIRDIEGNSTSVIAVVQDGSFVVANIDTSQFKAGDLTFTATAGDAFAQATAPLLEIPSGDPIIITTQPVLNGANKLTINGKAPSLKPNDELSLVVRDTSGTKVTATAVVQADGSFSVSDLSTQGLQDGLLIIDVMAQTINGAISVVNAANVTLSTLTPLGSDKTLPATEDVGLVIKAADFGYSNTDGFSMTGVKIAGLPAQGTLKLNGVAVVMDQFVSLADLADNKLVFLGAANANGTSYANFKFKVLDTRPTNNEDLVANTLTLNVAAVNDVPVVTTTGAINSVNEDSANTAAVNLWSTAPAFASGGGSDESSQTLTYKITAIPAFITLFKADGTPVTAGTTVTAIEFAALKYKTVADANGTGSVTFDVIDSGSATAPNINTLSSQSVSMTVTAVNDAPVLVDKTLSFSPLIEDAAAPTGAVGSLVSSLLGGITDADIGAAKGIAITGTNITNGTLYYSTNAGSTWTAVDAVSVTSALLLTPDANTRLYYQPKANYNGTTTNAVTFVAWDQTTGAAGTKVSTDINGGITAFSSASDTVAITVTPVNDAPVLTDTNVTLSSVIQGSVVPTGSMGVLVSSLVGGVTDIDDGAIKGIAITGVNTAKGTLYYSLDGGTNWSALTDANDSTARLLGADADNRVYFKAAAGTQGNVADALTFRAWDTTTGTEGQTANVTPSGGTTAFSQLADTVNSYVVAPVTINAVSTDDLVNVSEPLLISGKADPNAVVTLNINSQNFNVTANATGDWSYDGSKVRYVMVRKSLMNLPTTDPDYNLKGILTIGEVEIYEKTTGQNASTWAGVTQSYSNVSTFTTGSLRDLNAYYTAGNYVETSGSQMGLAAGVNQDAWVQIDLGAAYSLSVIKLMGAQNTNARMNGATIYTSATDMSALTKAQLDSSVLVNKSTPVTGLTNAGWQGFNATADAIYGNALNEGPNTITASELVQGVSSQATRVVTLDTIAPVTTVTSAALSSDTGTSNTDFITSDAAQTISGKLSANLATGEKVMVSLDNGVTWVAATATVGTNTWSLPGVTLSGTNTLQAKVVDTAGNGSTPFTKVYALVTVSDLTVGITQIDDNAGTATVVLSGGTSNDTTPQLTGNLGGATQGAALAANEVVNVYRTPNLAAATVLQAGSLANTQILSGNPLTHYFIGDGNYGTTGNVYLPTTPGDGHMVVFTKTANWGLEVYAGTTLVGNVGTANVPSGGQDNLYFKWDAAKGQWLTGTNALTKVGTAVVTTTAAGQSTWKLTDNTGLGNSDSVNYIAQVENTAGTFGQQSTPGALDWRYTVDNVAPSSITLIGTDDVGPVTGTIAANTVTNDNTPIFSGNTEANAVVRVFDGATLLGTTTANGSGAWSFTPTTAMATGTHSVTATATDAHGNTSASSTALPFKIDTTAPVAVADTNTGTEDITTLTGNLGTNDTSKDGSETYALVSSSSTKGSVVIDPTTGSYTYTRTSPANEITANLVETFTYSVTDAAGNTMQSTLKITLTPVNDAATFTGDINKTITETNAAETVTGTLTVTDVDSPKTITAQTAVAGSAGYGKFTISTTGAWSYTMDSAQNQFVVGQTYDDKLTVTTADGTQQEIKVTITGTNDTPTVVSSIESLGQVFFTENGLSVQARGGTITLADAEQVNLQGATVRVVDMNTGNPVTGDTLTFAIPAGSGITSSFDAATGTLTFTGSATQAHYQTLFNTVSFSNARNDLSGGARNVFYAVKDGSGVVSSEALTRVDVVRKNDAPVLDNTTNLILTGIVPSVSDVLPTGTVGVLVSTLVGGVTDADLTLADGVTAVAKGIAIVGANSALGKVYFSVNNGTSWFTPSFDLTDTTALLLKADANTRVFFRPNAGVEGTIANALTIRAWDTTDNKTSLIGANVIQHNVSASLGGTNAYSVAVDTVSLNVATVASAPSLAGTSGNDTNLTGTAGNDVILGNGGADVISAAAGNDKVVLNTSNVTVLGQANSANINGGTGVNILKIVGTEVTLDLTNATVAAKVDNFSTVDITSNVNNLLKLNLATVQNFSGTTDNLATTAVDESKMMVVLGDSGDAVVLQDAASWAVQSSLKGSDLATLYGADYGFSGTRQYSQYSKAGATLFVDELAPVGDIVGTSGNDTLTGTGNADVIYGNGGVDSIAAGLGKDTVILGASSLTALAASTNTAKVVGGTVTGIDTDINTLKLSGINLNLDLTNVTVMNKLDNFNVIDMKQGSGNKFKLGLTEVLALAGGADNVATLGVDESKMLVVQGNGGVAFNTLQLKDGLTWTAVTNLGGTGLQNTYGADFGFEAGRSYTQYSSATGSANLFVDQSLLQAMV
jgi:VCBS repeat-containing protein